MSFPSLHRSNKTYKDENPLWWRLPESQQGPHRRAYLEEQLTQHSIDKIVLDYFIQEGFHSAAEALALEAGIPLDGSVGASRKASISETARLGFRTIVKRKEIKLLILEGNIIEAIRVIGKYFPTILDSQPLLLFSLLRLNLIEMIRKHKCQKLEDPKSEEQFLNSILDFVRENMINKVTYSVSLLKDLETTMSLLCFDFDPSKPLAELTELPPKLRDLFNLSLRRECYREVNRTILELNDSTSEIHYHGAPSEFSPSRLQSLNEKIAEDEDTESDNSDDEDPYLMNRELKVPHFQLPEAEALRPNESKDSDPEEGKALDKNVLRSQLERIAVLWLATRRKIEEQAKKDVP